MPRRPSPIESGPVRPVAIDHVVLRVEDVERSAAWYRDTLGLDVLRLEEWRRGEVTFVSLRVAPGSLIDLLQADRSGVNVDHVAITVTDVDLEELAASGSVEVEMGPAELYGARGVGLGLYITDPDGNRVELRTYPDGT